jgi:riboflavin kinase/FMN adenylyltransferase
MRHPFAGQRPLQIQSPEGRLAPPRSNVAPIDRPVTKEANKIMRLARGLGGLALPEGGCVATIGNFDGVHLGHRAVIENLAAHGRRLGLPAAVVLFEPQPREFFDPRQAPARLTRLREKLAHLAKLPVDWVLLLRFDHALAQTPPEDFIERALMRGLRVKHLVVGDDFRFGKARAGDFALLRAAGERRGFRVEDTESVLIENQRVSSTLVREALVAGDMARAERMLGRPYSMIGRVRAGEMLGRRLGFPTANIATMRKRTPLQGVFAVTMTGVSDAPLAGVANLGCRPSVDGANEARLETHLFDFDGDLYGRLVEVRFHRKLRDERRFDSLEALREQIVRDAEAARAYFSRRP